MADRSSERVDRKFLQKLVTEKVAAQWPARLDYSEDVVGYPMSDAAVTIGHPKLRYADLMPDDGVAGGRMSQEGGGDVPLAPTPNPRTIAWDAEFGMIPLDHEGNAIGRSTPDGYVISGKRLNPLQKILYDIMHPVSQIINPIGGWLNGSNQPAGYGRATALGPGRGVADLATTDSALRALSKLPSWRDEARQTLHGLVSAVDINSVLEFLAKGTPSTMNSLQMAGETMAFPQYRAPLTPTAKNRSMAIPTVGPGQSNIDANIDDAKLDAKVNALDPFQDPFGVTQYLNNLMQESLKVTDPKRQNYKRNPKFKRSAPYGNFNFGATMQARGFSLDNALRRSDQFQRLTTGTRDPQEDVDDVANGWLYAQARSRRP